MRELLRPGSLGRRVFIALIAGEVIFAAVLGVTIGAFSAIAVAHEREESMQQVSATIAASIMPMVADQQKPQVAAQLASVLKAVDIRDVTGICISDAAGNEVACSGVLKKHETATGGTAMPWDVLFEDQVVVQPIVVDDLPLASVGVQFAAPGLSALAVPTFASIVVLLSVMLVSVPWTAWLLMRDVIEPLGDLDQYASRIAEGELDVPIEISARGEIGELQTSLARMAQQLKDRDERLRGSYESLEAAYVSLEQAKREIEMLSTVKSNFVAVAAHEIRGPLSAIRLYTELLETGELGELDEPAADAVAAIESASARLTSIVSDLMDSALLERGLMPIQFDTVWLEALIEEAVRDAAAMGQSRGMGVIVEGELPDIVLEGDALRLRQVLDNLLSNALKYSPDGTDVIVRAMQSGESVEIDVADRGRGVPQGSQSQLFALFGRLDFGDSRDTAGLGLGLAISARIVQAHGGRISYRDNEDGPGSIFSVSLPLKTSAAGGSRSDFASVRGEGADVA
ncbi:MAG TPA: HAMP domain-containing sensor histidine kinase [Coriobacteriia bacterium]|nr:HAMP domain-containing sensor histidine kinase [Coriobacteriia bacterium]